MAKSRSRKNAPRRAAPEEDKDARIERVLTRAVELYSKLQSEMRGAAAQPAAPTNLDFVQHYLNIMNLASQADAGGGLRGMRLPGMPEMPEAPPDPEIEKIRASAKTKALHHLQLALSDKPHTHSHLHI